jgi:hypothetical protein
MAIVALCGMIACKAAVAAAPRHAGQRPPKPEPISVSCGMHGGYSTTPGWQLDVRPNGSAKLVFDYHERKTWRFKASADELDALRKAVVDEQFFELGPNYGVDRPDIWSFTITVTVGHTKRTAEHRNPNDDEDYKSEVARYFRIWDLIYSLVADKGVE